EIVETSESLIEKGDASAARSTATPQDPAVIQYLLREWKSSDIGKSLDTLARSGPESGKVGYSKEQRKYHSTFLTQIPVLTKRAWSNAWRNEMVVKVKFFEIIFIGFFIDSIFWKIPEKGLDSQIQNRSGVLFFLIVNQVFTYSMGNLMTFYQERLVFEREYSSGMYSLPSYFISKAIVEVPFSIILPLLMVVVTYFAIGLQVAADKFFLCAITVILQAICGAALGLFASCTFKDINVAHAFVPMFLLPLMIFSGLFVNLSQVQAWIRWVQWISPMKYGYVALIKNEFTGLDIGGVPGEQLFGQLGLEGQGSVAVNIIACLGYCILLWIAAYMGLWKLVASSRQSIKSRKQA
ncbi:ABC-2 type transporter-domain-containing protein, partial [Piptocephalis cylindrospora]